MVQRFNWTDGCIALTDEDMEQVWQSVNVGTSIEIKP
ncbi:L,D-transpeptidase family protein [Desulfobacter postgatei]